MKLEIEGAEMSSEFVEIKRSSANIQRLEDWSKAEQ